MRNQTNDRDAVLTSSREHSVAEALLPTRLDRPRGAERSRPGDVPEPSVPVRQDPVRPENVRLLPPNTRLGRYTIVRHIKTGGMGAVYRAADPETGQVVAIKTMVGELAAGRGETETYRRFLREVQAACNIRHRNVIQIYGFDVHGRTPYLIMEYLRGEGLNDLIARGPLAIDRAADIIAAVCSAMGAVHDHQILHRDLKPSNIFLADSDEGEQVKVLDFGVSKLRTASDMTASNAIVGSVHYMSAEQARGARIDERSDQFAIGVVLYECLTGRRPHQGATLFEVSDAIIRGQFRQPRELRPDIPVDLQAVILRAMSLVPADRFASVRELGAAALPFASSVGQRRHADLLTGPPARMRRARRSTPASASWFGGVANIKDPGTPAARAAMAASDPHLSPTAALPRGMGGTAGTLEETRSLPGVAAPPSRTSDSPSSTESFDSVEDLFPSAMRPTQWQRAVLFMGGGVLVFALLGVTLFSWRPSHRHRPDAAASPPASPVAERAPAPAPAITTPMQPPDIRASSPPAPPSMFRQNPEAVGILDTAPHPTADPRPARSREHRRDEQHPTVAPAAERAEPREPAEAPRSSGEAPILE